jgi:hypothetical protein
MEQEINEIIAKNMPQAVGEQLRKRLEQADRDSEKNKQYSTLLDTQRAQITQLMGEVGELKAKLDAHAALEKREAEVSARERAAENQALRTELEAHKGNAEFARSVAMGLVRNIEYRNSVYESQTHRAMAVPQGGMVQNAYNPEITSRTDTQQAV